MINNIIKYIQNLSWLDINDHKFSDDEYLDKKCKKMLLHFQNCIFQINMKHCEKSWFDNTLLFDNSIYNVKDIENAKISLFWGNESDVCTTKIIKENWKILWITINAP